MSLYVYSAINKTGQKFTGKLNCGSEKDVIIYLKKMNMTPIKIEKQNLLTTDLADLKPFQKKITKSDIATFCKKMSFILEAGIPLNNAIQIILEQTQNKLLQSILLDVNENILKGHSLSSSMKKHDCFPKLMINMIKSGETNGNLTIITAKLAGYYERESKIADQLKNSMMYPIIVFIMMFFVLAVSIIFVIPKYTEIFLENNVELPFATRTLINLSNFITNNYILIAIGLIIIYIGMKKFSKTPKGKYFYGKLQFSLNFLKPFSKLRLNLIFAQTFSMLIQSGINITSALDSVRIVVNNPFLDKMFFNMISKINQGQSLSFVLSEHDYFDKMLCTMANIGENTSSLSKVMSHCENYFQNELENYISKFSKLIEPAITIFVGAMLAFVMLALLEPTFKMSTMM